MMDAVDTVCVDWRRWRRFVHFIIGRIVPGLSLSRSEDVVECGTEDVNAGRNEEYDFPLMHRWLWNVYTYVI